MEYIRAQCQPRDGKLLAIGHSMGGILLYAKLSRCGKSQLLFIHDLFDRYMKIHIGLFFGASFSNKSYHGCFVYFTFYFNLILYQTFSNKNMRKSSSNLNFTSTSLQE